MIRRPTARSASLLSSLIRAFPKIHFAAGVRSDRMTRIDPRLWLEARPARAVHEANVIVTATSSTVALFNSVDVTSGTRIVLIGSYKPHMREVDNELIRRAGIVVVDSKEACAREAGELIGAGLSGDQLAELGEVLRDGPLGALAVERVSKGRAMSSFQRA